MGYLEVAHMMEQTFSTGWRRRRLSRRRLQWMELCLGLLLKSFGRLRMTALLKCDD